MLLISRFINFKENLKQFLCTLWHGISEQADKSVNEWKNK